MISSPISTGKQDATSNLVKSWRPTIQAHSAGHAPRSLSACAIVATMAEKKFHCLPPLHFILKGGDVKRQVLAVTVMTAAMLITALTTAALSTDPFEGTWKLNAAESKFAPNQELKSQIIVNEAQGDGIKQVSDTVDVHGIAGHVEFTAKYDGKDYPIQGSSVADTISSTRIASNAYMLVLKRRGEETASMRAFFFNRGQTINVTQRMKNVQGADAISIMVLDKQ
jgi:hypothetical protein